MEGHDEKLKRIAIILILLMVIGFLSFTFVSKQIVSDAEALPIKTIDFAQIKDGEYRGTIRFFRSMYPLK